MTRAKPASQHEIKQLFVSIVRSATCKNVIMSKQGKSKKDRDQTVYKLNKGLLQYHLDLNGLKNKKRRGFAPAVVERFGLEATEDTDMFLEEVSALDA